MRKSPNVLPIPKNCNLCGGEVIKTSNARIYGKEFGRWPYIYYCTKCENYVGLHPNTDLPLGTLADVHTRVARRTLKPCFDRLWKEKLLSRSQAYKVLAEALNIDVSRCHWGMFDFNMCNRAAKACVDIYKARRAEG